MLASILFGGFYILYIFIPTGTNLAIKELYKMLPYVVTLVVLIIVSLRKKREDQPPASLGLSYFREEHTPQARTLAPRKVFFATYTPRKKTIKFICAVRGAK